VATGQTLVEREELGRPGGRRRCWRGSCDDDDGLVVLDGNLVRVDGRRPHLGQIDRLVNRRIRLPGRIRRHSPRLRLDRLVTGVAQLQLDLIRIDDRRAVRRRLVVLDLQRDFVRIDGRPAHAQWLRVRVATRGRHCAIRLQHLPLDPRRLRRIVLPQRREADVQVRREPVRRLEGREQMGQRRTAELVARDLGREERLGPQQRRRVAVALDRERPVVREEDAGRAAVERELGEPEDVVLADVVDGSQRRVVERQALIVPRR